MPAGDKSAVNATFLQPFVAYTTKTFTTFGVNTESTYDWQNSQWTVPLNLHGRPVAEDRQGAPPVSNRWYATMPNVPAVDPTGACASPLHSFS